MEPERPAAQEPTAAPQPVAAAPMAQGPIAAGLGLGSLASGNAPVRASSPSAVLALQRAAGNQAVANLLQRQEKERTEVSGPGDFGVAGGEPKSSGNVQVTPAGDKARIQSPDVKFSAKVWRNDDKKLEQSAYVGYVQNLAQSDRGAVYRRGGDPAGEIVSEDHTGLSNRWDAVNDPKAEERGEMTPAAGVFAPFYWKPGSIDDSHTKDYPVQTDPAAHDQPEFSVPVKKGPGRITQFKGKDEFKLGLAVKKGDAVHMLRAYDWEVSWDADVDANISGAGKAVQSVEVIDALNDGPNTSLTDWSLDPKAGDPFEGFATVAEAMKRTPGQLMNWLLAAQKHDQVTYRNICAALDAKNAGVNVSVACAKTNDLVGRDQVHVRAEGSGGGSAGRTVKLKEGESQELSLSIKELFGSAAAITAGSTIKVEVSHMDGPEGTAAFGVPLSGSKQMGVGSGSYTATLSVV
jgi:hypothetical protein